MLLTSWVRSFRQSLLTRRRASRRNRNERLGAMLGNSGRRSRMTERLEERTLLTALVFDSTNVNPAAGIQVTNTLLDPDNDGVSNFDRVVVDSVSFTTNVGVNISLSNLEGLDEITLESLSMTGSGTTGVNITLNNMTLEDGVVIETSEITSSTGGGIDISLTDVELGTLTLFDTTVSSGPGVGVNIDVDSVTRNSVISGFDVAQNTLDGISITGSGTTGAVSGASNDAQIRIFSIDHGLQPGSTVTIEGVQGNVAANTTDTILADPTDPDNFFLLENTDGSVGLLPSGQLNGAYTSGGVWTLATTLNDVRITGNTITDTTLAGEEGVLVNLQNTSIPNFVISDNVEIKGISVNLNDSPVDGLSIRNNQRIESTAGNGIGFTAVESTLSNVRVEGNTVEGDGANGGSGISFNLNDSNFDGFVTGNTVTNPLLNAFELIPTVSDAFVTENGGPLTVSFVGNGISNNTFTNTSGNNAGAGMLIDLPKDAVITATVSQNTVTGYRAGGFDFSADDTADAFDLTIVDNRFSFNRGRGIAVVLEDAATGEFDISRNIINRGENIANGDNSDGIYVSLIGIDTNREATNILRRSTISENMIGTPGGGRVAVPMSAAGASLIIDDLSGFTTEIVDEIDDTDTTITVSDITKLPPPGAAFNIRVGMEEMTVTGVNAATSQLTVTRGVNGTVSAEHDAMATLLPLNFDIMVDGEQMSVTNIVNNTFTVTRTDEDTNSDGFFSGGEDANGDLVFNRRIAHEAGTQVVVLHGGMAGAGINIQLQEQSEIQDLLIDANFIANNLDDGIKFEREDDGSVTTVNPRPDQNRALTISNNAIMANASAAVDDVFASVGPIPFGAGIDFIVRNGSLDTIDVEIRSNVIAGNTTSVNSTFDTRGISLRAEADGNILADIVNNDILFNSGEGIQVTTRANTGNDERDVSGTWISNTISHNGSSGILLSGDFGQSPLRPLVIGIDGNDPVSGLSRGNVIEDNGRHGIEISDTGNIALDDDNNAGVVAITNNTIHRSGRDGSTAPGVANAGTINGAGIWVLENANLAIKNNTLIDNAGIGIDLEAVNITTASIRNNLITGSGNDGIEFTRGVEATLLGNAIDSNAGRGIDLFNFFTSTAEVKIGDGTEAGRNLIVGNRLEGVYVVNSAGSQDQNTLAVNGNNGGFTQNGSLGTAPNMVFQMDTNTIDDNGRDSTAGATGFVMWVGSTYAGSPGNQADAYTVNPGSREGTGDELANAAFTEDGTNSRVNANIVNNSFQGNFGDDVKIRSFTSTVDPSTTTDNWGVNVTPAYRVGGGYDRDPLARLNLVFAGNSGNSIDVIPSTTTEVAHYDNSEPVFKSRDRRNPPIQGGPAGPFNVGGNRDRSAQNVASRSFLAPFSGPNAAPTSIGTVLTATSGEGDQPVIISTGASVLGQLPTGGVGTANNPGVLAIDNTQPNGGFTAAPTVTITQPGATTATAQALMGVESVLLTTTGTGFIATPAVAFQGGGGTGATGFATLTTNLTGAVITDGGAGYISAPAVGFDTLNGAGATGQAFLRLDEINIIAGGAGYTPNSTFNLSIPGAGAAVATVDGNGVVTSVNITNVGSGYSTRPSVTEPNGVPGSGAAFEAFMAVDSVVITNGGGSYVAAPNIVFSGGSPTANAAGVGAFGVQSVTVTSAGVNYTSPPTLSLVGGGVAPVDPASTVFLNIQQLQITDGGADFDAGDIGSVQVNIVPVNGQGAATGIVTPADLTHGLQAGEVVEITGVGTNDPTGIHSANGVFFIGIPTDPNTGLPDNGRFFLVGTEGTNSPDHVARTGTWVMNNAQPGVNASPGSLSFLYDGMGPSTFRVAQGFDSSGFSQQDEFQEGDNFTQSIFFASFEGSEVGWGIWTPAVDDANPNNPFSNSFVDPTVSTVPQADIIPVTPDPRRVNAGVVTIDFSEPVTGVDINDFRLTRDGVPVDISAIPVLQISQSRYTMDLSGVTAAEGAYEVKLDNQAPEAVISPITPDPTLSDAGVVTVEFSEPVTGVDIYDFVLARDISDGTGFKPVDLSETGANLQVRQLSATTYTIDLSSVTDPVGSYRLDLRSAVQNVQIDEATSDGIADVNILAPNHGFATGQTVTISSIFFLADGEYRITAIDDDNFTLNGTAGTAANIDTFGFIAFDPEIIDGIGLTLPDDATEFWSRANQAPVGEIVDVTLDPRDSGVDSVRVIFSEPVQVSDVGLNDFSLTRDIGSNPFPVSLAGATITPDPRFTETVSIALNPVQVASQFIIGDLADETDDVGLYRLTLLPGGIRDVSASAMVTTDFDEWTVVTDGPSPTLAVSTPGVPNDSDAGVDTYTTAVSAVFLNFDEPVNGGVEATDLVLIRTNTDGTTEQLDLSGTTITDISGMGTSFLISGLESVTEDGSGAAIEGSYSIRLSHINDQVSTTPITNGANQPLAIDALHTWQTDVTRPTANIFNTEGAPEATDFSPSPRVDDDAGIVTVLFNERITGINRFNAAADFTLELDRNDGNGFVNISNQLAGLQVRPIDPTLRDGLPTDPFGGGEVFASRYVIDLSSVGTGDADDGDYRLTLSGSFVDPTGNEFTGDPDQNTDDLFVPSPVIEEWTRLPIETQQPSTIFDAEFTNNVLQLEATERFVVDTTAPFVVAGSVNVSPDPRNSAVGTLTINFSEDVTGVDLNDFVLRRDASDVSLAGLTLVQVSASSYTVDLNLVTGAPGAYEFLLDGAGSLIEDAAGNPVAASLDSLDTWVTEIVGPAASFGAITTPRNDVPDTVQVNFTKAVTTDGVDLSDFSLRFDDGTGFADVDLLAAGATVTPLNASSGLATMFELDLSGVADSEGTYRLSLNAASSGIVDESGNILVISQTVEWLTDQSAPVADIVDIAPDPRTTEVELVNILFRDSVSGLDEGVSNFDISDLVLTRDGMTVDITSLPSGHELTQQTPSRYTINLSSVTVADGDYELTVNISDITDLAGNALIQDPTDSGLVAGEAAQDAWTTGADVTPPTVTLLNVAPDPANELVGNAGVVTVGFSEDVSGVDIDDFRLFRDSVEVTGLAAAGVVVTPVPGTAAQYTIDLTNVTETPGSYELQVVIAEMDIKDRAGLLLEEVVASSGVAATDSWDRIIQLPTATISSVLTPRLRPVGELTVTFTEPVTGVDLTAGASDFTLTRDNDTSDAVPGQPVSLSGVTVEQLNDTLYAIDLTSVTGVDGFYQLTLTTNGNIEAISNGADYVSPTSQSWTTITSITVNTEADTVDVTPGNGVVADATGAVSLRAAIMEANALAGADTIILPAGNYALTAAGAGEDFAASGDLDIRDDVTIIGAGAGTTTIDASGLGERIIQVFSGVNFNLSGVTLTGGSVTGSEDGGAIRSVGTVTISDAVITGNSSQDDGGAINNSGVMTISRSTLSNNTAGSSGGAIRNSGTLTIASSTIGGVFDPAADPVVDLRNVAGQEGGGLINVGLGIATITDSTFSGNVANVDIFGSGGRGGAISNRATLVVRNATITENSADVEGGGIFSTVAADLQNTIVAGNSATASDPDVNGSFVSSGNNIIGDVGTVTAFVNGTNNDQVGNSASPVDPLLGALADNGGPTLTHALLQGSSAIDAGDNTGLLSSDTDQRGSTRILDGDGDAVPAIDVGSTVDIGAFEFGGLFVNDSRDLPDENPGDGLIDVDPFQDGVQITLRAAIMEANALPGENTIVVPSGNFVLTQGEIDTFGPSVVSLTLDVGTPSVGTATAEFDEQVSGVDITDFSLVETRAIQNVSGNAVAPIVITTTSTQGLVDGDQVTVSGVQGNTAANGTFAITVVDATTFTLNGTTGNGDYLSGGQWSRNVDLVAAGIVVEQTSSTVYTIDLSSVTEADGQYVLTLTAAGSGIQDVFANPLVDDATANAVRGTDSFAPTVSLAAVSPDPRSVPVTDVSLSFSENITGLDISDFTLTQSQAVVATSGLGVGPIAITTASTAGLTSGSTVTVSGVLGNTAANGTFTISVVDATTFTLIGTVGDGDYTGGGQWSQDVNLAAAGVSVQQVGSSQSEYTVDLSSVTGAVGDYTLTLNALNSFIQDLSGNQLQTGAADSWTIVTDTTDPVGTIVDVSPDPRINSAGLVTIQFDEPVTGVDIADFVLTRDVGSGASLVDISGLTVDPVGSSTAEYTIDLSAVSAADGTYTLTLNAAGSLIEDLAGNAMVTSDSDTWIVGEDAGVIGDLDVTDTSGRLRIVGAGAASTVVDANDLDRVFHVLDGVELELFDITVTGGQVTGGGEGGGILNSGQLLVSGSVVTDNTTDGDGGGIHSDASGSLTVTATTISNNSGRFGGGIFSDDDSTLTLSNGTLVTENTATLDGGGIYNDRRGTITISSSGVSNNVAGRDGGGFYVNDVSVTTVTDSVFEGNTATRSGGGIFNEEAATLTFTSSTLRSNTSGVAGGALFNDDGQVTVASSTVALNDSSLDGGAIFNQSGGTVAITSSNLTANDAVRDGGAIKNFGAITLNSSDLTLNTAGGNGGALQNLGTATVTGSTFGDNSANEGGAIENNDFAQLTLTEVTFDSNSAIARGGALLNSGTATATLIDNTLDRNAAGTDGGGVYHDSDNTLSIDRTTISNNTAGGQGAGVNNQRIMTVVNSTVSGNAAGGSGGGFFNNERLTLANSTIVLNSSAGTDTNGDMSPDAFGGGVYNNAPFDPVTVTNTIIASNTGSTSPDVDGESFTTGGNNLIGDVGAASGFVNGVAGDLVGSTATAVIDPQLAPLGNNGGPTLTHALLFGSPARDGGNNTNAPATDQRGFSRIVDGDGDGTATIDIGAYESGFVVNSFVDSVDALAGDRVSADDDGLSTLRASVIEANALAGNNTIVLGAGTFSLSRAGRDEDGALTGDLDITDNLTILGAGAGLTIIDGASLDRVFDVHPGVTLNVSGVTVIGGLSDFGGGFRNRGELVLDNAEIQRNAADYGGGIFNGTTVAVLEAGVTSTDTTLTLVDGSVLPQSTPFTLVIDNEQVQVTAIDDDEITVVRAVNGTTAASHVATADVVLRGVTTVRNSLIGGRVNSVDGVDLGNKANVQGGGVFNTGELVVVNSAIAGNEANAQGGGVFNDGIATITASTIGGLNAGNDQLGNVSGSRGGGIYNIHRFGQLNVAGGINDTVTTLTVDDASDFPTTPTFVVRVDGEEMTVTQVSGTTLTVIRGVNGTLASDHAEGATVSLVGRSSVTLDRSTVASNVSSSNGAGVYNGDEFTITTTTISGNVAGGEGGGLDTVGALELRSSTVTANSSDTRGGGVSNSGTSDVRVSNTIVAFNTGSAATTPDNDVRGTFISDGNNLIGDSGTSTGFVNGTSGDQVGSSASPFDPIIGPLADNGGPTLTHALLVGSPAIDNADNTGGPEIDQRGEPRPTDATADIGAYELGGVSITIDDVAIAEGDSAQTSMEFTLRLSRTTIQTVSVDYVVQPGLIVVDPLTGGNVTNSALAGSDFLTDSGTVTFTPGELVATLTVFVNGDTMIEPDEVFNVVLSNPVNGVLVNETTVVTSLSAGIDSSTSTLTVADPNGLPTTSTFEIRVGNEEMRVTDVSGNTLTVIRGINGTLATSHSSTDVVSVIVRGDIGTGTIQNDDTSLSIDDVSQRELDAGTSTFDFTVSLDEPTVETTVVDFEVNAGTTNPATLNVDVQSQTGTLTFAPGESSKTVSVVVAGDTTPEAFETFTVDLTIVSGSAAAGDLQGLGTIQNDDVRLIISGGSVTETTGSDTTLPFTVTMVADDGVTPVANALDVTVDVTTADGTATAGSDYTALAGQTVTIPAGMMSVTQNVTILGDTVFEGGSSATPETFTLGFDTGTVTVGGTAYTEVADTLGTAATGSIVDDELPPTVWVIRRTAAGTQGEVLRDGTDDGMFNPVFVRNYALVANAETVNGDPGTQNDRFIVDFDNGNPIPDGGLTIDGGDETAGDSLEIIDSNVSATAPLFTFDSVVYTATGVDSGTIDIDDGLGVMRTITYTELEPVLDTVAADERTFEIDSTANPGDHQIRIADAGGMTIIDDNGTNAFENVTFTNPTISLTVNAGDGNNTISVSALDAAFAASFTLNGEDGIDNVDASALNVALSLNGGDGADVLLGGTLNDTIEGGAGSDSIDGGAGNDTITDTAVGSDGDDTLKGGTGLDTIRGGVGNDSIEGGSDGDSLFGGDNDDTILGDDGPDFIDGGEGSDSLLGGEGNDTIVGQGGGDVIRGEGGQDSLDGGADSDTVDGGSENDTVLGGDGADSLLGGDGDDSVDGGADNDTLAGGAGTDNIIGGTGDDEVSETADGAENIVLTDTGLTVGGLSDTFTGVEKFVLTGGDQSSLIDASGYTLGAVTIDGAGGDDTILGSAGNDFINGGAGNDTINGNDGNDSLLGGASSDELNGGSGNDTLTGNSGADTLNGGTGLDSILGGNGNDVIDAGDDNDTVLAGAGNDSILGGLGNDRILGEGGLDTAFGGDGQDTLIGGLGADSLMGEAGVDLVNGNGGRDALDGGADDDTVFGGSGQDTLIGGQGVDNLDGQGSSFDVIQISGEATDDVFTLGRTDNFNNLRKTSGTTYGVNFKRTERIELNTLDGNDTFTVITDLLGSDGDATIVIDFGNGNNSLDASPNTDSGKKFNVLAGTGNDTLIGSAGVDNLNGGSGDDSIEGGDGNDTLTGGAGADFLNGNADPDVIDGGTENDTILGGGGDDTLTAGSGNDSISGNAGDDTITAADGNDIVYGGDGNDTIRGGNGDDSIDGGADDDQIFGDRGFDIAKGGDGQDFLSGGDNNDTLSGENGNDQMSGDSGSDVLLGGADNDNIFGGSNPDTLIGGTGADFLKGQGSSNDIHVAENEGSEAADPGDTIVEPTEIDNAFVLNTAILDRLNAF